MNVALEKDQDQQLYIIGVGTSAGGVDALSKFLVGFRDPKANVCIIIAQHLDRNHKSELSKILDRICAWPVVTAENGISVQPHTIYVTPENRRVIYEGNKILLEEFAEGSRYHPSIDELFFSIAKNARNFAVGIILSGTAKDGVRGISAIKKRGGLTIAQLPESAQYPDMAVGAIDSNDVDLVLYPEKMYGEVVHYINNRVLVNEVPVETTSIDKIFAMLARRCGTDFSQYKQKTILRRINKRVEALRLNGIDAYCDALLENPLELDILFNTVLIGVTEFFRDPDAFEQLREHVRELIDTKQLNDSIRVWSVGCATGEEPYSIAILLAELLGEDSNNYQFQLFASDIDEQAINTARNGYYTFEKFQHMDERLIEKYFDQGLHGYTVKKSLKKHLLFNRHDITNDPPFVKLDLVVCRNLLIYFDNSLQKEVLRVFNFALKEGGLLFLGKSENIGTVSDLFAKEKHEKIYRKGAKTTPTKSLNRFGQRTQLVDELPQEQRVRERQTLLDAAKDKLIKADKNPFIVVNENGDIKEIKGSVRLYLEVKPGELTANIFKMANPEFVLDIRSLVSQVSKTAAIQESPVIKFSVFGQDYFVKIRVLPLIYSNSDSIYFIVLFDEIPADNPYVNFQQRYVENNYENLRITELEDEAKSLREHLKVLTETLESNNEEMQAVNEEFQSANEELKSSNEELETSNEELQSTNEELHTSNNELRIANEQLFIKKVQLKEREQKLIVSEQKFKAVLENIPVICWVARADGHIYWYNSEWYNYTGTTPEDMEGWGWQTIHHPDVLPRALPVWQESIKSGTAFQMTFPLKGRDGTYRSFLTRIIPLKDSNGEVLEWFGTNTDVNEQRVESDRMEQLVSDRTTELLEANQQLSHRNGELDETQNFLNQLINSSVEYISVLDEDLNFITINDAYAKVMNVDRKGIIGRNLFDVIPQIKSTEQHACILEALEGKSGHMNNHRFYDSKEIHVDSYFIPLLISDVVKGVIIMKRDVSHIIRSERLLARKNQELNRSNEDLQQFAHVASHDLKEPVRKIQTYTRLIEENLAGLLNERTRHYMARIVNATDRIYSMIDGVLEYSSVDSDAQLNEQVDLNVVVNAIREDLELYLKEKDVLLTNDKLETVEGGSILLYQVFYNLIKNAIKFSHADRLPVIDVKSEIHGDQVPAFVTITITDNGIGFSTEDATTIFGTFTRLHSKDKYEGTGLGLALCEKIVHRHGGFISAKGTPGMGATFTVMLPLKQRKNG